MPNNPFDDAAASVLHQDAQSTAVQIRNNVQFAVGQSPDQAAQYQHLAKYVGVPVETVQAQPEAIKQQAALKSMDADKMVTDYPALSRYMIDPSNVAKSHDDIAPLGAVEQAVKALPAPSKPAPSFGDQALDFLSDNLKSLVSAPGAASAPGEFGKGVGGAINKAAGSVNLVLGAFPTLYDKAASLMTGKPTTSAGDYWFKNMVDPRMNAQAGLEVPKDAPIVAKAGNTAGNLLGMLSMIVGTGGGGAVAEAGSVAGAVGQMAAHGAKSMAFPAITDSVATANNVYQQTGDLNAAMRAAQMQYLTTSAAGVVPLGLPGSAGVRAATGFVSGATVGEAGRSAMNMVLPASMAQPFDFEQSILSGLAGAGLGTAMGPRAQPAYHEAVRQTYVDASKAAASEQGMASLQGLSELASASKTRERDPEGFKAFVKSATEDGQLHEVYVEANKFAEVLNQSGVDISTLGKTMPEVAEQFRAAVETNGDIRIPVEDYATHIAGGKLDAALLPHLKVEPDGFTHQEGQEYFQNQQADMKVQAEKILAAKETEDAAQADAQVVHDKVLDQLNANGRFRPEVNNAYAALTRDFYTTMAERAGLTPRELFEKYPLKITSDALAGSEKIFGQDNGWGSVGTDEPTSNPHYNPKGTFTPATNTMRLFKGANLSTYLHESGHFFLEALHGLASGEGAPEGIRADFDTLLTSFGEKGATPEQRMADWSGKTLDEKRAGHEQFARSFEKYLMDGKAPSLELQGLFSRFRSWLLSVYRNFTELPDSVTPEVRQVMDRLLASDEAIRHAEQARSYLPLEKAPDGTTAEQFAAYQALGKDATEQAVTDMTARSMRDMQWASNAKGKAMKALQKEAATQRKAIREEVTKELEAQPARQAEAFMRQKENKGLDKDIAAEMFGFADGKEMTDAIEAAGKLKDQVEGMTDQRMLERHGELIDGPSIERAAEAAIHNEARARFMATGLKMLSKSPIPARQLAEAAKQAADAAIAAKRVRDLRPAQHAAEEARANREAVKLAPKDPQGAVQAQRAALLNNRLFKAATDAVAEVQKGVDYLKKFDKPAVREKLALEYRDQIDTLLDRFDLRKSTTLAALDGRESLVQFVERMAAAGLEPQVPVGLLNEARQQHFKDMTVEEFRGLVDAIKSIDHLGRKAQLVADGKEMREIAALADEAAAAMAVLPQRDAESNRGLTRIDAGLLKLKSAGRSMQAALLKMEQMIDWLDDRNPNGVLNRVVFRRIADAGVHEAEMQVKIKAGIDELLHSNLADVTKDGNKIYTAPGLIDGLTGKAQRFTKKEMLALAGNMGNDSNMAKLLAGEKWSETGVRQFLDTNMTKADWDFVAGLGKTLETLWPEKLAMSRRLGNTNPEKIAPRAFDTPHGRYDGWYWPMVYDPARAQDVAERGAKAGDSMFENIYTRANTDTGRMNTRNENYARPLLLSLDVIPRVIKDEIHDIAYREAIMDADKFLSHPTVRESITSALSPEHYEQLRPWLQSIANDRKVDMQALKWFDALAHGARTRATIVGLGYRISTMLVHGSSAALESVAEVGPVWFGKGLADFANPRNWEANKDFVFERSGEMRNRMNEVDRDVREHLREIDLRLMDTTTSALARGTDLMKAHAYQGIAMLDMASALPTWMGAYHKGMAPEAQGGKGLSEADAIYFADKTVRNAHGGTGIKDQAAVQRGPEFFKLFTMFYTFWNHNVNRLMDTSRMAMDANTWRDSSKATTVIMRFLIYTLGIQTMHGLLHPKKDEEGGHNWLAWAAEEFAASAFAGIPILRDLSSHYLTGKDYSATPAASMVQAVGSSGIDAANALTGKEVHPKVLKHTITTAGYALGLPLGQPASTSQFLWDVTQGKQQPQDLTDWWNGIIHGDIKKH